jgi:RNA polymerase sigma factor (sigma-70 family)
LTTNSLALKREINYNFNLYYYKIRLISYLSKLIYFEAINYDKNARKIAYNFPLILDKTSKHGETSLVEQLSDSNIKPDFIEYIKMEDHISDYNLFKAITKLTDRQKEILFLTFIKDLNDTEVAQILRISQQAVTKTKNKALEKLRGELNAR